MKKGFIKINVSDYPISNKAIQVFFDSSIDIYLKDNLFYATLSKGQNPFYIGNSYSDIEDFLIKIKDFA